MKLRTAINSTVTSTLFLTLIALTIIAPILSAQAADQESYVSVLRSTLEATAKIKTWEAYAVISGEISGSSITLNGDMTGSGERLYAFLRHEERMMAIKIVVDNDGIRWTEIIDTGGTILNLTRIDTNQLRESYRNYSSKPGAPDFGQGLEEDPSKILEELGPMYTMAVTGTETIDEVNTYILHGTIKNKYKKQLERSAPLSASGYAAQKIRIAIGVEDGFVRKFEKWDADDFLFITLTFSKVKINPALDDDYFDYTPPEGVEINDQTELYVLPD